MPEEITTQIIFWGQTVEAKFFRCGGQAFVIAAVSGNDWPATKLHPSEKQEFVILDLDANDRVKSPNIETMASFRHRLFADSEFCDIISLASHSISSQAKVFGR